MFCLRRWDIRVYAKYFLELFIFYPVFCELHLSLNILSDLVSNKWRSTWLMECDLWLKSGTHHFETVPYSFWGEFNFFFNIVSIAWNCWYCWSHHSRRFLNRCRLQWGLCLNWDFLEVLTTQVNPYCQILENSSRNFSKIFNFRVMTQTVYLENSSNFFSKFQFWVRELDRLPGKLIH